MRPGSLVRIRKDFEIKTLMVEVQDPRYQLTNEGYFRMSSDQLAIVIETFQDPMVDITWSKILAPGGLGFIFTDSLEVPW